MDWTRRSGVLAHPTMLPGRLGAGDLGPAAHAFVAQLAEAGQAVWQVLPLGPPDGIGSPYAAASAFAGDALLVSPEALVEDGLLARADLARAPSFPEGVVAREAGEVRLALLERARAAFEADAGPADRAAFEAFRADHADWLHDHALFQALRRAHGAPFWERWPAGLRRHLPRDVARARRELRAEVEAEELRQWLFRRQWEALRAAAHARGVEVFGDVPIFVARDSADVWAHPELFWLDAAGEPTVVAGVPPDVFSVDGQLWGNPLFDWGVHARTGYAWWIERVRRTLELVDLVRIDHFRGFAGYWEIPAAAATAREGRWVPGPGPDLFAALEAALGPLPVVAEDLGVITPDVTALLERTGLPGMKILQFAFDGDPGNPFLPENMSPRCVAYPGTHDNQTTAGWLATAPDEQRARLAARVGREDDLVWGMAEVCLGSPAFLAVLPLQDVLELDDRARTNVPGTCEGNWSWRLRPGELDPARLARLRALTAATGRLRA